MKHGIKVESPLKTIRWRAPKSNDSDDNILYQMRTNFQNLLKQHKELDLIVAIFDNTNRAYEAIKTCGDLLFGIVTQCLNSRKADNPNDQIVSNILLKINGKLGGVNFVLSEKNEQ